MAFVSGAALPSNRVQVQGSRSVCRMRADGPQVTRRGVLAAAAAALVSAAVPALAEIEYGGVGFLGGSDVIDINNANVRVYQKFPGMYPTLAGKIVSNGPYDSVNDLYKLPDLTENQKKLLDKYKDNLTALKAAPEYVIDRFNNGLYR